MFREESIPVKVVDSKTDSSYTSDTIDMGNYKHLRVLSHSADSFNGTISILALLSCEDSEGAFADSGTNYKPFGGYHTVNTCEYYRDVPRKVKVYYTGRTAGTLDLWVQRYND